MGGRGSRSGLTPGTGSIGGGGGGIGPTVNPNQAPSAFQMQAQPPNLANTPQQAQAANASAFPDTDNSPYHQLYNGAQYYQNQNLTADQINAVIQYLRDDREPGSTYSMSQNMNYRMMQNGESGKSPTDGMNANQRYTYRHMMGAMHNLGYNVNLTRYDHAGFVNGLLQSYGVRGNMDSMTEAQLKSALVGRSYSEHRFVSTSYNGFKNAPPPSAANNWFTFTDRQVEIRYSARAAVQAMMPGNGPGGRLGEIVLAPSQGRANFHITNLTLSSGLTQRKQGTPYGSQNGKKLVLYVDVD